jgi:hypothetical protein
MADATSRNEDEDMTSRRSLRIPIERKPYNVAPEPKKTLKKRPTGTETSRAAAKRLSPHKTQKKPSHLKAAAASSSPPKSATASSSSSKGTTKKKKKPSIITSRYQIEKSLSNLRRETFKKKREEKREEKKKNSQARKFIHIIHSLLTRKDQSKPIDIKTLKKIKSKCETDYGEKIISCIQKQIDSPTTKEDFKREAEYVLNIIKNPTDPLYSIYSDGDATASSSGGDATASPDDPSLDDLLRSFTSMKL